MPAIRRISDVTIERQGASDPRLRVRFKISHLPDDAWIDLFRSHATASAFGVSSVIIHEGEVSVDIARPSSAAELATAMDCFIECANLKLRALGGQAPRHKSRGSAWPSGDRSRPYRFS